MGNLIPNVRPNVIMNVRHNLLDDTDWAEIYHTSTSATWTATLKGPAGNYVTFDWGDGSAVTTLELAEGGVAFVNDFSGGSGSGVIRIYCDLANVTSLVAVDREISEINSFENLVNLTYLNLNNNSISDISAPAGLTNLTYLNLNNNSISDISALVGLTNLTYLNLNNNSISDISALVGLTNLTYLNLQGNSVVYLGYVWFTATSGTFRFNSTVDSSAEVDQWLIDLEAASWATCTVYLDGTNPARTSDSDDAVVALVLAGVTLHLN